MKAAGDPDLRTRDLVVMMGGSQPLHPGSTPGVCTSIDNIPTLGCKLGKVRRSDVWNGCQEQLPNGAPGMVPFQFGFRESGAVNVTMC